MRYHRAIAVTKPEADFIINAGTAGQTDTVVVSRGNKYFDVRGMSRAEVDAFVADLARAEHAETVEQTSLPS